MTHVGSSSLASTKRAPAQPTNKTMNNSQHHGFASDAKIRIQDNPGILDGWILAVGLGESGRLLDSPDSPPHQPVNVQWCIAERDIIRDINN
jgi:hypothetical protein